MFSSPEALTRAVFVMTTLTACNPYDRFGAGDDGLGPVDPVNFPAANLGTGGNRKQPGVGAFTARRGYAGGNPIEYFSYPLVSAGAGVDPLRLTEDDAPVRSTPPVYVFGADYQCTPPAGYVPDPRLDEVPRDQQGNIFTALPQATYNPGVASSSTYLPVVSSAPVTAGGLTCQQPKSEEALTRLVGKPTPDGTYLAWLIIDPGAAVYPVGQSVANHPGVGLQLWGWYSRYLLAYLDGGVVPTAETTVMEGEPPANVRVRQMVTQRLYYPRSQVIGSGDMPMVAAGRLGAGYDVLGARRGDALYSPLCAVFTYDAGMPLAAAALPRNAADIEAMFNTAAAPLMPAADPYVFCLQVQP
jgi:hypothetical protein